MAITIEMIQQLRKKSLSDPVIYLVDFFDKDNNVLTRLTNYYSNFMFRNNLYLEFPFIVSIPEFNDDLGQVLQFTFGNFQVGEYSLIKTDLRNTKRIEFYSVNLNSPDNPIYPKAVYFHNPKDIYRQDDTSIRVTFSRRIFVDKKYPFNRYNSAQHPTLYEDFEDAPVR